MENIKCYLSRILGERRISQRELSRMTGLSTATINKIYNETWTRIDRETMMKLCKALNIGVGDLFEYIPEEERKAQGMPSSEAKGR